jgi:hypothetical protein
VANADATMESQAPDDSKENGEGDDASARADEWNLESSPPKLLGNDKQENKKNFTCNFNFRKSKWIAHLMVSKK